MVWILQGLTPLQDLAEEVPQTLKLNTLQPQMDLSPTTYQEARRTVLMLCPHHLGMEHQHLEVENRTGTRPVLLSPSLFREQ